MDKRKVWNLIKKYFFLIFGCFLLAFGDAAFISPLGLVTGGVLSIGVIVQHFIYMSGSTFYAVDIVTWAIQIIMLVVSFIFMGKIFTMRSAFATILYPALFTILTRVPMVNGLSLGNHIAQFFNTDPTDWGLFILAGLAGGALVGAGVGVCYHGGGSTGGLDVISAILARKTPIKESASAFVIDALLVIAGIFIMRDIRGGLVGVLGAFSCALAVQYIYVEFGTYIIADIVSNKHQEIQEYVHKTMDRTATIIPIVGSYSQEEKIMLRVAFSRRELYAFRALIGIVDPNAFVTFTKASMINGEGFDPLTSHNVPNSPNTGDKNG